MYVSLILSIHFIHLAKVSLECSNLFSASENREAIHKIALLTLDNHGPLRFLSSTLQFKYNGT